MSDFLRSGPFRPVQPELLLYLSGELDPRLSIDAEGQLWVKPTDQVWVGLEPEIKSPRPVYVLYGDVPVIIHTKFEFSIYPMSHAPIGTGRSTTSTEGDTMEKEGFLVIKIKGEEHTTGFVQTEVFNEGVFAAVGQVADFLESLDEDEIIEVKKVNKGDWLRNRRGRVSA